MWIKGGRPALVLAVCIGAWACDETPVQPPRPALETSSPAATLNRPRATLTKTVIDRQYLVGLRPGQNESSLDVLLPDWKEYSPNVLPGSPTLILFERVPTGAENTLNSLFADSLIQCLQPNFRIAIDPAAMTIPNTVIVPPSSMTTTQQHEAVVADGGPFVGLIDTGAFVKLLPRINQIVWKHPGEDEDTLDDDSNGYVDDWRGVNMLTAIGPKPPLPAGSVQTPDATHGSYVAAVASGVCGHSEETGELLKVIPCVGLAEGSYFSKHFVMCLRYFLDLAKNGVPIVAINGSFGTTTEDPGSCEVQALRSLRDEGVLFTVAAGLAANGPATSPGRHRVANVLPVASLDASSQTINSAWGKSIAFISAAVGDEPSVSWPLVEKPDVRCVNTIGAHVSFAVPQVTNLIGRLAAQPATSTTIPWFARRNLVLTGGTALTELKNKTLSGHLVPHADAVAPAPADLSTYLKCTDATAAGRVHPIDDSIELNTGSPLLIQAYNLRCNGGHATVPVTLKTKNCTQAPCEYTIDLTDTGASGDEIPDDGLYGAEWKVPPNGWTEFTATLWPSGNADSFDVLMK